MWCDGYTTQKVDQRKPTEIGKSEIDLISVIVVS